MSARKWRSRGAARIFQEALAGQVERMRLAVSCSPACRPGLRCQAMDAGRCGRRADSEQADPGAGAGGADAAGPALASQVSTSPGPADFSRSLLAAGCPASCGENG